MEKSTYRDHLKPLALVMLLSFVVYSNIFRNEFVYDDIDIIIKNDIIKSIDVLKIFSTSYWGPFSDEGLYRPLVILSYALNYKFGELNPFGYHLINVLVHAFNCILVYCLVFTIFKSKKVSAITASLFATHTVHTEAVTGVVGRAEVFAFFFFLLAFLLYLRDSKWAAIPLFLGLLSKENAVLLLPVLIVFDLTFKNRVTLKRYVGFLVAIIFWFVIRCFVIGAIGVKIIDAIENPLVNATFYQRILTAVKILGMYLKLMIWPMTLSATYSYNQIPVSTSILEPQVIASLAGLIIISLLMYWSYKNLKGLFFSVAFLLLTLLPASNIITPIGTIMGERLAYLPSLGFCMALGIVINEGYQHFPRLDKTVVLLFLISILLFYSGITLDRNSDWKDSITLWTKTVETSPNSAIAHYNLGLTYDLNNRLEKAVTEYKKAISIYPDYYIARWNLIVVYYNLGRYDEGIKYAEELIKISPNSSESHAILGGLYFKKSRYKEAIDEYEKALAMGGEMIKRIDVLSMLSEAHNELGITYGEMDHYNLSIQEFKKAIDANPKSAEAYANLGAAYASILEYELARDNFKKAIELDPANEKYKLALERLTK